MVEALESQGLLSSAGADAKNLDMSAVFAERVPQLQKAFDGRDTMIKTLRTKLSERRFCCTRELDVCDYSLTRHSMGMVVVICAYYGYTAIFNLLFSASVLSMAISNITVYRNISMISHVFQLLLNSLYFLANQSDWLRNVCILETLDIWRSRKNRRFRSAVDTHWRDFFSDSTWSCLQARDSLLLATQVQWNTQRNRGWPWEETS